MLLLISLLGAPAQAAPDRVIPPSVLAELQDLENDFELALAMDCDASRCFSKGCSYLDHAVADQARSTSMPGLGQEAGPGSEASQEYLTRARCSYAHEEAEEAADLSALNRRLQAKLSSGWVVVSVSNQSLQALPEYLRAPHEGEEEEPVEVVEEERPPARPATWTEELWSELLPHFFWMFGVLLATLAALTLIWGWRRLGRMSVEEQALLAELGRPEDEPAAVPVEVTVDGPDADYVVSQQNAWSERLARGSDPAVGTLLRDLLRSEDRELLVHAMMRFPELSAAFPKGGDVAADKLALAELVKNVEPGESPDDAEFFEKLNRHALSATLSSQADTAVLRSLRQDFGASGLAELIAGVPGRIGGLLFALSPLPVQLEMARLLAPAQLAGCSRALLLSNRLDRDEAAWVFEALEASRRGESPSSPAPERVADQGAVFDAAGALSVLLAQGGTEMRRTLFSEALTRFGGSLPAWHADILVPDMLFVLSDEARADLMLGVDAQLLSAWLGSIPGDARERLVEAMPRSLQASVSRPGAVSAERAEDARVALAKGFQDQLRRAGVRLEQVVG
ncbi:MAG: hypothetical protein GY884_27690 [Proteobacteria bacterium]|nr:hypothetical protein [Pseudomonadota bacterium]